ncbi:MAG TPA: MBL fold metallo-hydrolase [Bacillales bacterium]
MKRIIFLVLAVFLVLPLTSASAADQDKIMVHYLNVGQADCILIQTPGGKNVLIDSGTNARAKKVLAYLRDHDVEDINILIATHPHHDHIGAMDELLEAFSVDVLYLPPLSHSTHSYQRLKNAVANNETTVFQAKAGQTIRLTPDVRLDVLAPLGANYKHMNNNSLVLKLTYGKNRFLFMGDASEVSENEIMAKEIDVQADVIKIGHHGGDHGTSESFLKKVDPDYAVITSEKGDKHFPSGKVIDRLKERDVTVFRSDQQGTIIAVSDGESIVFHLARG